jgi:hypothetical protein
MSGSELGRPELAALGACCSDGATSPAGLGRESECAVVCLGPAERMFEGVELTAAPATV